MSEPKISQKDMLWRFDELVTNVIKFIDPDGKPSEAQKERDEIDEAIRRLIEHGKPKVSRKDIFNFRNNLVTMECDSDEPEDLAEAEIRYIENWLQNKGVEIEEKEEVQNEKQ